MATSVVSVETAHEAVKDATASAELATHEALDDAAHQQIAQTEDEDYKWLTDRLDALQVEQTSLRNQMTSLFESRIAEVLNQFQQSRETQAQLIATQSDMIRTLMESVTRLSESALSTSTRQNSGNESEQIPETEVTVTESQPENASTQEENREPAARARKKHPRI